MKGKSKVLVTLADKNYVGAARQLFSSAYFYGAWDGDMLLLAHEEGGRSITRKEISWFVDRGIKIRKCRPLSDGKVEDGNWPSLVLDKFYIFTEEFKKWDNIVFLDADTIVTSSLENLVNVNGFFAVEDHPHRRKLSRQLNEDRASINSKLSRKISEDYNLDMKCFNAGVMAFSKNIIESKTFLSLLSLFNIYNHIIWAPEQAIFNLYFYKKWKKIPQYYNYCYGKLWDGTKKI